MRKKMTLETYSGFFQKYNVLIGIIICALFTSILLTILPIAFFFLGDIYLVIGCFFGLYITFRYKKESQSHMKIGIIVGLVGSVLSLLLINILFALFYGFNFIDFLLYLIVFNGIMFIFIGLIFGFVFGYYYKKKEQEQTKYPLY